jgi:hypothetical protein
VTLGILRRSVTSRPSVLLFEQGTSTLWSFILGALIARLGGKDFFGLYATVLAVNYFLASPLAAATVSIVASDAARLARAKAAYLDGATRAASRLALVASGGACLAVAVVSFKQHVVPLKWTLPVASAFVFSNLAADVLRRTLLLGPQFKAVAALSTLRLVSLLAVATPCAAFFGPASAARAVALAAATISVAFLGGLLILMHRRHGRPGASFEQRLAQIAFHRQITFGKWGFMAGLVMTALDQGTLVVIGLSGKTEIAGEIRAAAYLFGLMSPVLLVLDLFLPTIAMRRTRGGRSRSGILILGAAGGVASLAVAIFISFLSAMVWVPSLGPSFAGIAPLSWWAGAAFGCMMTRSFLTPIVRIRAPRSLLISSICGTIAGLAFILGAGPTSALIIQKGLLVSAITLATTTFATGMFFSGPKELMSTRSHPAYNGVRKRRTR